MVDEEEKEILITEEALVKARETTDQLTVLVLKDMVVALNETKLKLLLNIKDLKQQLNQHKEDQADIYYYLNKKCDDAYETISNLEDQLLTEQSDREQSERLYERRISELQNNSFLTENKLQSKIRDLEDKLALLKDFVDKKDESEKLLENLIQTLESERKQFTKNANEIETRFLRDREKLKSEYHKNLQSAKTSMAEQVHEKLSKSTKKTKIINTHLSKELHQQTIEANKVLQVSYKIEEKDRDLKIECDLLRDAEKELVQRLASYQRIIKQLNTKVSEDEILLQDSKRNFQACIVKKDEEISSLKENMNSMGKSFDLEINKIDSVILFLANKFSHVKSQNHKKKFNQSIDSISIYSNNLESESNSDKVLLELIDALVDKYPDRFAQRVMQASHQHTLANAELDDAFADSIEDTFLPSLSQKSSLSFGEFESEVLSSPTILIAPPPRGLSKGSSRYGIRSSHRPRSMSPGSEIDLLTGYKSVGVQTNLSLENSSFVSKVPPPIQFRKSNNYSRKQNFSNFNASYEFEEQSVAHTEPNFQGDRNPGNSISDELDTKSLSAIPGNNIFAMKKSGNMKKVKAAQINPGELQLLTSKDYFRRKTNVGKTGIYANAMDVIKNARIDVDRYRSIGDQSIGISGISVNSGVSSHENSRSRSVKSKELSRPSQSSANKLEDAEILELLASHNNLLDDENLATGRSSVTLSPRLNL